MKQHTKDSLITAIAEDEQWHFKRMKTLSTLQWTTMIAVAVAGFLTTFAGTPAANGTFMSYPESLLIVGIITAVGATINQGGNFSSRIARHRAAALSHKIIWQRLHDDLTIERASALRAKVFADPDVALRALSSDDR